MNLISYGLKIDGHPSLPNKNVGRVKHRWGVMKSMDVNYMCANKQNANDRLANKDLTPRMLSLSIMSVGSDTN